MKRNALFVGVDRYADDAFKDLRYSVSDAAALAGAFTAHGFDATVLTNPSAEELLKAVERRSAGLGPGDVFLLFFAGHGFTAPDGAHLLICSEDRLSFLRHNRAGVPVDLLEDLTNRGGFHRAFLLDACRTDVFAGMGSRGSETRDLALVSLPDVASHPGTCCVLRSCDRFCPALEFDDLGHGVFTRAVLDLVSDDGSRGLPLGDAFVAELRGRMHGILAAHGMPADQNPCFQTNGDPFRLFDGPPLSVPAAPAPAGLSSGELKAELAKLSVSEISDLVKALEGRWGSDGAKPAVRKESVHDRSAGSSFSVTVAGASFNLRWIPANGSRPAFWMGETQVTQKLWTAVMGSNPSYFKVDDLLPVETISWNDCQDFLKKLNAMDSVRKEGLVFRLPTEEEWERACLAGGRGGYCRLADGTEITAATLSRVARFGRTWNEGPAEVGTLEPNAWGLFDMHGNVCEWTLPTDGGLPAARGGGWYHSAENCSARWASRYAPGFASGFLGLRIAASFRSRAETSDSTFAPRKPWT